MGVKNPDFSGLVLEPKPADRNSRRGRGGRCPLHLARTRGGPDPMHAGGQDLPRWLRGRPHGTGLRVRGLPGDRYHRGKRQRHPGHGPARPELPCGQGASR